MAIIALSLFAVIFIFSSGYCEQQSDNVRFIHLNQYQHLAKALAKGQFYLDLDVSEKLLSLENPYDTTARDHELELNKDYYLDYSFYNGKYYSYFGVVPCLLFYLPYYSITGHSLNNMAALSIITVLYFMACFYLIYQLFSKYFPKSTYRNYILCTLSLVLTSGIMINIYDGRFYNLPIVLGATFVMLAYGLWLKASKEEKIKTRYLLLGSIFMALVAGCRPHLCFASVLIIPIFYKQISNKELFKIKNLLAIFIPVIIVAAFIMYYNYARFGSILDFGVNYNLTSNDMRKRGFVFERTIPGIINFLFEVPHIKGVFPFIDNYNIVSSYKGLTISEYMLGGALFLNMFGVFNFLLTKIKKYKELFCLSSMLIIMAITIIVLDVQLAGIIARYITDFGFLLSLSAIIIYQVLISQNKYQLYKKIAVVLIIISFAINFFIFFANPIGNNKYFSLYNTFNNVFSIY